MTTRPIRAVENYTKPFLVMAYVNLLSFMVFTWALYGYLPALAIGYPVHLFIQHLARRKGSVI
ncbi:hypothetical protein [Actibacterium pelagium]|uniref:Uncharacterized protein n=1 Tax=Actibacterium pelagium TaxID=2029103 RepID=A0A917AGP8_9RHOB|nr:hypothetical protein [Actibacterium pelagium]GGE50570.1 hypothetical protein GCM10011517_17880 [Actibacterium pelagium]